MLTVSDTAYKALADKRQRDWLVEAAREVRGRHPQWAAARDAGQVAGSVEELCLGLEGLSAEFDLSRHENFLRLVDLVVETGWPLSLTPFQRYLMERSGFSEDTAVTLLCADVRRGSQARLLSPAELGLHLQDEGDAR